MTAIILFHMDRKKPGSTIITGTALIAIFVILWNGERTIPAIWKAVSSVLYPLLGGIAIAFIISLPAAPIRKLLRGKMDGKKADIISAVLSLFIILLAASLIFSLIIPEFISACGILVSQLSAFASNTELWNRIDIEAIPVINGILMRSQDGGIALTAETIAWLEGLRVPLIDITLDTITSAVSAAALFFISLVFAFYFLTNRDLLKRDWKRISGKIVSSRMAEKLSRITCAASSAFSRYIAAQVLEAVIIGTICFIGMLIFQMPYAAAVSAFTGLMALIPIYGAVIGAVAGAFIIAVAQPIKGLIFLIFIFVLQQLEGDLIYPRVVGTSTGLPPIYVFAAVTLGGILFGLAGMILAVPVVSSLYALLGSEDEASSCPDTESERVSGIQD